MDIQKNVPLADYTTFHIGGVADEFIQVTSRDELVEAVQYAKKKKLPFFVLGSGANILVGDKGFRGLVIKNEADKFVIANEVKQSNEIAASPAFGEAPRNDSVYLTADSGAVMSDLIGFCARKGLSGLEHFAGIPSTVGGALWQNLHFLSPERTNTMYIGDILVSAEILSISVIVSEAEKSHFQDEEKKFIERDSSSAVQNDKLLRMTVGKDYFHFGYDDSILHHNKDIVLSATFQLTPKDPQEIENTIDANLKWREEKHPKGAVHCSAGSVFKKIENHGAGRLIEQVGLKGHQIGGAQISEKHANFIINTGNATAKDVVDLIDLVKEKVKKEIGLTMQTEISMVGEF